MNSVGNWDTVYNFAWLRQTPGWDSITRDIYTYNSFDYVNSAEYSWYSRYVVGAFDSIPSGKSYFYYEEYTPTAVTAIQTPSPEITAYPNPVSGKLHIDGNIGSKNVSLQLISITGMRLFNTSGNWQSMNKEIDVSTLASGVYYLLITDDNGNKIAAKQIVKN